MSTILKQILSVKEQEVRSLLSRQTRMDFLAQIADQKAPRSFSRALKEARPMGIISEVKKASPSEGIIRPDFDPVAIACRYRDNGATALSILTDRQFFQGDISYLQQIRQAVSLPLLRKDFIIDPLQVLEARAAGADAILLIVAALNASLLSSLQALARELGMEVLVEVHNRVELEMALKSKATLIGINNRDLNTFMTDLNTTEELAALVPDKLTLVAESGIRTHQDLIRMQRAGANAVLVGTHLMRATDPGIALHNLIEGKE